MLNGYGNLLAILATVLASAVLFYSIQKVWSSEARRQHNELIGWHLTVIGSTYAVIIGFMLYAVWTNFNTADANAEAEANALVDMVRASRGLPAAQRSNVAALAIRYAHVMISSEWPLMAHERISPSSHPVIRSLWATLITTEVHAGVEQVSLDHSLTELTKMTEYRRLRMLQVTSYLPDILWLVLILGAVVTIVSACLFGASDVRVHLLQVVMLSLIISSVLVAIADINLPFEGSVHVDPTGFESALVTLSDLP